MKLSFQDPNSTLVMLLLLFFFNLVESVQMILEAIEALNEKNGSNKTTILRYIEEQYNDLPEELGTLLFNYLTKMKEAGELVFWKNNYSKPDPNAPPRRGRGRPPKPKSPNAPATVKVASGRGRGRPPKDRNADIGKAISKKLEDLKAKVASGRPRGRPRKMTTPSGGISGAAAITGTKRSRGRPPKVKAQVNEVSVN